MKVGVVLWVVGCRKSVEAEDVELEKSFLWGWRGSKSIVVSKMIRRTMNTAIMFRLFCVDLNFISL